jgi:adenylate kinase family enzyme
MKQKPKKIAIIGSSASGKSSLAHNLSKKIEAECYFLDELAHIKNSNWKRCNKNELKIKHNNILKKKKWMIEGNYSYLMKNRFLNADLIIFIDFNPFYCLFNFLKRHYFDKNPIGANQKKSFFFNINVFYKILLRYPFFLKHKYKNIIKSNNCKNVVYLKSFKDINLFINNF